MARGIVDVVSVQNRYSVVDRYVLFELGVSEARSMGYGDVTLPPDC